MTDTTSPAWGRRNLTGTLDSEVREAMARKPQCWCGRYLGQCSHPKPNVQRDGGA